MKFFLQNESTHPSSQIIWTQNSYRKFLFNHRQPREKSSWETHSRGKSGNKEGITCAWLAPLPHLLWEFWIQVLQSPCSAKNKRDNPWDFWFLWKTRRAKSPKILWDWDIFGNHRKKGFGNEWWEAIIGNFFPNFSFGMENMESHREQHNKRIPAPGKRWSKIQFLWWNPHFQSLSRLEQGWNEHWNEQLWNSGILEGNKFPTFPKKAGAALDFPGMAAGMDTANTAQLHLSQILFHGKWLGIRRF